MQNLTHNTRSALIKLASNLPRGSHERRSILAGLNRAAMVPDWQPVTGAALQKAIRIFGGQFRDRGSLEGRLYAAKVGRKTVFARDSGVIRLYVRGDDDQIYSMKVYDMNDRTDLQILVRAAAVGMTEEALRAGVYTNGKVLSPLDPDSIHITYVNPGRVRLNVNAPNFAGSFEATADAGAPEKLSALLAKAGFAISPEEIEAAIEVA